MMPTKLEVKILIGARLNHVHFVYLLNLRNYGGFENVNVCSQTPKGHSYVATTTMYNHIIVGIIRLLMIQSYPSLDDEQTSKEVY